MTLKIISSMATKEVLKVLAEDFQKLNALPVAVEAIGGVDVNRRVRAGEVFDLVVLAASAIDQLIVEGHLLPASRVDFVTSGIVAAVRTGDQLLDLSSEEAVKQSVLSAKTISYSTGPSGVYLEKLFAKWEIAEQIKSRIVLAPPGVPVGGLVAKGQAQLGFQQLSELFNVPGITLLGPLPPEIQLVTTFSAGIASTVSQMDVARRFLEYIVSNDTMSAKERSGMQAV
jgi:molybdate transport system substrate-binding protein